MAPRPKFLDIPIEIRLMIYGHLLVHPYPIRICFYYDIRRPKVIDDQQQNDSKATKQARVGVIDPTILRTNKIIYAEARGVLYSQNRFCFPAREVFVDAVVPPWKWFLDKIGHHNAALIRHIGIIFLSQDPFTASYWIHTAGKEGIRRHYGWPAFRMAELFKICPGITTLEVIAVDPEMYFLHKASPEDLEASYREATECMDSFAKDLKSLSSLKEITVHIKFEGARYDNNLRVKDWQREIDAWNKRGWGCKFTNTGGCWYNVSVICLQ